VSLKQGFPKVTVLICTLNEVENLPHVLPKIPDWVEEIVIVDGNSTDGTVELAKRLCPRARLVFQHGKGKGVALRCGLAQASGNVVITLDADGETDPVDIPRFLDALMGGYDFAKGSRLANGRPRQMPAYRWFGNKLLALTFNLLYGTRFTDICSGYNALWRSHFLGLPITYDNCEAEQQMLARAKMAGMKIVEVPHSTNGRIAGSSKVSGIKQGLIDWFVIIMERFRD
jgi:glycosyltransferase involved in cell wall biosynthesis